MAAVMRDRRRGVTPFLVPDPAFGWFLRSSALVAITSAACFGGLLWWYHGKLLDLLGLYELIDQPGVHEMMSDYAGLSLVVTGIAMVGMAGFVILTSMFLLHRIVGPAYRIKLHMMDLMAGGTPRPVRLREGDKLADLAGCFNEFLVHAGVIEAQGPGRARPPQVPEAAEKRPPADVRGSMGLSKA